MPCATPCLIAEKVTASAQRNLNDGQPLDTEQLLRARSLLAGQDMPDKVKACLLKVVGHALRQDGTLTPVRVREAALNAMHEVNTRLAVWHRAQERAGTLALDAVPAERLDGESLHVQRYRRTVFCLMQASLTERFRSIEATGAGQRRAETLDSTVDDLRRDASWAIDAIQGRPRMTIALI